MPIPEIYSSTPSVQSGNSKKSWNSIASKSLNTKERRKKLERERQVIARLNELGYTQGDNSNFPCFCGEINDDTVWWMSNCKSRSNHLFCTRCTKRVFEPNIKETLNKLFKIWKINKWRMWKADKESILKLLSKGNNA
tara:strand:+ start:5437 stop:5850 length:414 start_codon:yes stop_codon:yes gene_type:complete